MDFETQKRSQVPQAWCEHMIFPVTVDLGQPIFGANSVIFMGDLISSISGLAMKKQKEEHVKSQDLGI